MASIENFSYSDDSFNYGFFAYRSAHDTVELGFKISGVMTDLESDVYSRRSELAESALDLISGLSEARQLDIDGIDFDLVDEASIRLLVPASLDIGEPFADIMPHSLKEGDPFCLILRDDAVLTNVRKALTEATDDGRSTRNLIKVDVVRAHDDDMRPLYLYEELTGNMS